MLMSRLIWVQGFMTTLYEYHRHIAVGEARPSEDLQAAPGSKADPVRDVDDADGPQMTGDTLP